MKQHKAEVPKSGGLLPASTPSEAELEACLSTNEKPQKPLTESITNILKLLPTYRKPSKRLHTHIYRFITEVEIILDGFEMPTTHWPKMLYFLVPLPQAMWIKKNASCLGKTLRKDSSTKMDSKGRDGMTKFRFINFV